MAFRYIALKQVEVDGVVLQRGDLAPIVTALPSSVFPYSQPDLFEPISMPDSRKSSLYVAEMDYDTGEVDSNGNPILVNRLVVDPALLPTRIAAEKSRLSTLIAMDYEQRMISLAVGHYSQAERDSFTEKLSSARTWFSLDDTEKDAEIAEYEADPLLYSEDLVILFNEVDFSQDTVQEKRERMDTLCQAIVQNNVSWRKLIGTLTRDRKTMWAAIDGVAETEEGLDYLLGFTPQWSI